ncbi:NAD-dependent epimerase/dehydratase family protein, partial [Amycolatopsis sp. NPDC059021]|uniref:NAD-dependent epimerase/dehydratase family protein n=1 Tax=Amycolatopsis sp. NPDC059021 TaxID=3346704 RepID=UPI003672FDA1
MRCLITGGAGFIGSHLTDHLLALGHEVTVLDDLSTGSTDNLPDHDRLRFVHGSVCDADVAGRCVSDVDCVYHLAAAVGVFTILDRTLHSLRTNLLGTETMLEAVRRRNLPILVASTSEVYGKNTADGLTEEADRVLGSPLRTRWSYAEAKALDETYAYLYAKEYGVRSVIVRLFNTVGPRQTGHYGMVVPRFVTQALTGEPVTVFGDGRQVRCFCHVADIVPALVALLANENAHGTVFNLGNPRPITIGDLAAAVISATGSGSRVVEVPYREAYGEGFEDMQRRVPDCAKAANLIGFEPVRTLDTIIGDVIADRRARRHLTPPPGPGPRRLAGGGHPARPRAAEPRGAGQVQ